MEHDVTIAVGLLAACFVLWAIFSDRLGRWGITGPIFFVALGLVLTHGPVAPVHLDLNSSAILGVAEVTLAVVLFGDASRINARHMRSGIGVPLRLLVFGLPLSIALGALVATLLLGPVGLGVAASVAAIVAPTDAALGASILEDERVPAAIRQALNVESGLNDGIATPFVNLFLAGAVSAEAVGDVRLSTAVWELLGGAALGIGIGVGSALLLGYALRRRWSAVDAVPLGVLGLAVVAYAAAVALGVNGFVSAFACGSAFGTVVALNNVDWQGLDERAGTVLSLVMWFLFGAVMLVPGLEDATWRDVLFALAALTVVRMIPVAVALFRSGLDAPSVLFVGWFGPRGLASIVFGLIAVDALQGGDERALLAAVTMTILLSVVLHGVTSGVGPVLYLRMRRRRGVGPAT